MDDYTILAGVFGLCRSRLPRHTNINTHTHTQKTFSFWCKSLHKQVHKFRNMCERDRSLFWHVLQPFVHIQRTFKVKHQLWVDPKFEWSSVKMKWCERKRWVREVSPVESMRQCEGSKITRMRYIKTAALSYAYILLSAVMEQQQLPAKSLFTCGCTYVYF